LPDISNADEYGSTCKDGGGDEGEGGREEDCLGLTLARNGLSKNDVGSIVELVVRVSSLCSLDLSHNLLKVIFLIFVFFCVFFRTGRACVFAVFLGFVA
jgi:hypothetical protein